MREEEVEEGTLVISFPDPEEGNKKKIVKGRYKAVSEGYWIFIKPNTLEKGVHEISAFASCKQQVLNLDVHHTLHII